ncbi:MAG TPA: helix-turn-helix domain-containing protein [Acidimicrobiales bacterium]|nr:helix-turn-helix domain-containing protein [Acidimicrobiales bacterium]
MEPSLHDLPPSSWPWPWLLRGAGQVVEQRVRSALAGAGIEELRPGDVLFLALLARGIDTIDALARNLEVTRQAVSKTVDSLVRRGYVVRAVGGADRRRVELRLSDTGADAARVARSAREEEERRLEAALGPAAAQARAAIALFIADSPGVRLRTAYARRSYR